MKEGSVLDDFSITHPFSFILRPHGPFLLKSPFVDDFVTLVQGPRFYLAYWIGEGA
jgi:hypothetical protein